MSDFLQHMMVIPDSQLDPSTSWLGDSKEGQLSPFTWICACHFRLKGILVINYYIEYW